MRCLLPISVLILASVSCTLAQNDRLYLVDNGFLKGSISNVEDQRVVFVVNNSDTLHISSTAIVNIKLNNKKKRPMPIRKLADSLNRSINHQFYYLMAFGGHIDNSSSTDEVRLTFSGTAMYRLSGLLQFGLSVDYNRFAQLDVMPVYFNYIGQLSQNAQKGIFYYGAIGLSKVWKRGDCDCNLVETEGGRIMKLGLGYRFPVDNTRLSLAFGWLQQRISYQFGDPSEFSWLFAPQNDVKVMQKLNGVELKLGIVF